MREPVALPSAAGRLLKSVTTSIGIDTRTLR